MPFGDLLRLRHVLYEAILDNHAETDIMLAVMAHTILLADRRYHSLTYQERAEAKRKSRLRSYHRCKKLKRKRKLYYSGGCFTGRTPSGTAPTPSMA